MGLKTIQVYQLYLRLKKISPRIWRRVLVRSDNSLADLHYYIQIMMGWEEEHLHQFMIRRKSFGINYVGGTRFSDNANKVYLKDFEFYIGEKFMYQYDFHSNWEHEIRVEKMLPIDFRKFYPVCISGRRTAPPEGCGGAWRFMQLCEKYSPFGIYEKLIKSVKKYQTGKKDRNYLEAVIERLEYCENRHSFDKQNINKKLQEYLLKKDKEDNIEV